MMDTLINTIMKRKQELIGVIIQTQSFPARVVKYIAYLAWLVLVVNRVDSLLSFLSYIILLSRFMSVTRRLIKDLKCLYICIYSCFSISAPSRHMSICDFWVIPSRLFLCLLNSFIDLIISPSLSPLLCISLFLRTRFSSPTREIAISKSLLRHGPASVLFISRYIYSLSNRSVFISSGLSELRGSRPGAESNK